MKLLDPVGGLPFVGPNYEKKLSKLGITTISDLLHHIPHRYLDFSKISPIKDIKVGETVTVFGRITSLKNQFTKSGKQMQIGQIEDETGKITIAWFNQSYLIRMLYPDLKIAVSGELSWFAGKPAFFSPEFEKIEGKDSMLHTGRLVGIYPETQGLSTRWLKSRIKYALDKIEDLNEFLDDSVIKKHDLLDFKSAITKIHFPENEREYLRSKERLSFNEFFNLQLEAKRRKEGIKKKTTKKINFEDKVIKDFIQKLPFSLTNSQLQATKEILEDLQKTSPMNRLLQGDVGSGKTVVAAISSLAVASSGYQVALMAPTQILANQHYETFNKLFKSLKIRTSLITGSTFKKDVGKTDIYIGTHALLNHSKLFNQSLGLVIIDEQHKFGVRQISTLTKKRPHVLVTTATPIPRTIAQTLFSDLDLSILKESPSDRTKIKTWLVPNTKKLKAYGWIKEQIKKYTVQAFVVCPLVEDSDAETLKDVKAVKSTFQELKTHFNGLNLGLLHGKLKEKEKNKVLNDFKEGKIHILVTTPVVEVGIDIPNATIMVIEAADRFGLSQLHQLRGRIGRGEKESYCLLFTENNSEKTQKRLKALTQTSSGFELAEIDFKLRGAGEVLGTKQHGFGNLKIADWSQTEIIKASSEVVKEYKL